MLLYLIVFLGAGLGGALRHGVNLWSLRLFGPDFPWGTLTVNVVGSFVMGVLAAWFAMRDGSSQEWRLFLTTGILGGFTTFSTFSLDTVALWMRGEGLLTAAYVAASLVVSVALLFAGMWLVKAMG